MKREDQSKSKRSYRYLNSHRSDSNLGPINDHNIQVNSLPEEGSYVIVDEMYIYERSKGDQHVTSVYIPSSAYIDAMGFPIIFRVAKYTKGKSAALDPKNDVVLERVIRKGKPDERVLESRIRTILVATGSIYLEQVSEDFKFKTKAINRYSFDEFITAKTSTFNSRKISNGEKKIAL